MQATWIFYIAVAFLTVVPLLLFNIPRVFVKKPPEPLKINWVRMIVIMLLSGLILLFLATAYTATMHERYEIALEDAATHHAKVLVGDKDSWEAYKSFLVENGTDNVAASFDALELDKVDCTDKVGFQLSSWCIPKYWDDVEGFEQVDVINAENPVYVMYLLEYNGEQQYYVLRMVNTDDGWLYDWIGNANDQQQKGWSAGRQDRRVSQWRGRRLPGY